MKLALGTVQFGLQYGVANTDSRVTRKTVEQILTLSRKSGIDTLDTAISYGNSEKCLGEIGVGDWDIVTKLPPVPIGCRNFSEWVYQQFESSLRRLNVDKLKCLMLHSPIQLLEDSGQEIWPLVEQLKLDGRIEKIGVSIYSPTELDRIWSNFKPDLVQAPFNILDTRMKTSGWFDRLRKERVEIHVRSVFLQGLLLMDRDNRPDKFHRWNYIWRKWENWLLENNLTPVEAALGFVLNESDIDRVIIGVDTPNQLKEILTINKKKYNESNNIYLDKFAISDTNLINPSNWSTL